MPQIAAYIFGDRPPFRTKLDIYKIEGPAKDTTYGLIPMFN